jgi:CBS domain-containing protein/sporulation protein YlmC with PRC-barrel domain
MRQFYLSELIEKRLESAEGDKLGHVFDVLIDLDLPEPEVKVLVLKRSLLSRELLGVRWEDIETLAKDKLALRRGAKQPWVLTPSPSEILLRDFLLDKQIVDTDGAKVERVNDLQFLRTDGRLMLIQVDVGLRGIVRRLGWEKPLVRFSEWFFDYTPKERFIAWHYVQPLADPNLLRLQISQTRLASLHPADLADIMEEMDVHERAAVVESMEEEILADALEEMEPRVQVSIMRGLNPEKAADIIEEMPPDEAADLIADLPANTAEFILSELDDEYEQKVRGLLEHDEDEAGGLMSTRFVSLPPTTTIVDALAHIKRQAHELDVVYYTYVVDAESHLLGVVSMRELLSEEVFTPLERIMTTRLITARVDDEAPDLANMFAKYGFRAIPVVDDEECIVGVLRFKALLEVLAPHLGR